MKISNVISVKMKNKIERKKHNNPIQITRLNFQKQINKNYNKKIVNKKNNQKKKMKNKLNQKYKNNWIN